jgi:hypothetical protein
MTLFLCIFNLVDKSKTYTLCSTTFYPPENRAVYETKMEKYCRTEQTTCDNIIRRQRFTCVITKATNTHSEYVIRIAFPLK